MDGNAGTVDPPSLPPSLPHGHDSLEAVRNHLHELAQGRASLSHVRKTLPLKRAKLHNQRSATAHTEGLLMNMLRELCQMQGSNLPQIIAETYDKVRKDRDALGAMEEELLVTERTLVRLEWDVMGKESNLRRHSLQNTLVKLENTTTLHSVWPAFDQCSPPPPPPHSLPKDAVIIRHPPPPPPPPPLPRSFLENNIIIPNPPPPPPPALPRKSFPIVQNATPPRPKPTSPSPPLGHTIAKVAAPLPPAADRTHLPIINQPYRVTRSEPDELSKRCDTAHHRQEHLPNAGFALRCSHGDPAPSHASAMDSRETCDEQLAKTAEAEVEPRSLRQGSMQSEATNISRRRRAPEPMETVHTPPSLETSARAQTYAMLASSGVDLDYKLRVGNWLLGNARSSNIEGPMHYNTLAPMRVTASDTDFSGEQPWSRDESSSENSLLVESGLIYPSTDPSEVDPIPVSPLLSSLPQAPLATDDLDGLENATTLTGYMHQDHAIRETSRFQGKNA